MCSDCVCAVKAVEGLSTVSSLTMLKEYKEGSLVLVSGSAIELMTKCEEVFNMRITSLLNSGNIANLLANQMKTLGHSLPECHQIASKIINRYCRARVRLYVKEMSKKELNKRISGNELSSKSMAAPRRR